MGLTLGGVDFLCSACTLCLCLGELSVTSIAPRRISAHAEDCVKEAAELVQLLNRLSDADQQVPDERTEQELITAIRATRNAINGIKLVVRGEVRRYGL